MATVWAWAGFIGTDASGLFGIGDHGRRVFVGIGVKQFVARFFGACGVITIEDVSVVRSKFIGHLASVLLGGLELKNP